MKAVYAQCWDKLEYYEANMEHVSAYDNILDLLDDFKNWKLLILRLIKIAILCLTDMPSQAIWAA